MLRFCNNATSSLKLNESASAGGEYILEGVFAELGVMNVNHRIYTEEEYLKHLQYLREDVAKGDLLGELDHPEDRFEVKMHEVSHQIIDIWYDQNTKMVMGKIKLLSTPNGELAKRIVDAGIPLHISSRAAGSINKDNTVSIQQIYTYDIVAKPGFSKATLHRVNESAGNNMSEGVVNFLKKTEEMEENNLAGTYGFINEDACVNDIKTSANLRKEAIAIKEGKISNIDMNKLSQHISMLNEEDAMASLEAQDMDPNSADNSANNGQDNDQNNGQDQKDDSKPATDDNKSDGENKEQEEVNDPYEVVAVEVESSENNSEEGDKDGEDQPEDKNQEEQPKDGDQNKDNASEEENTDECCGDKDCKDKQCFDAKQGQKCLERTQKGLDKITALLDEMKKKNEGVNESVKVQITTEYPFAACLNESDLKDFSNLTTDQKNKVRNYLVENRVVSLDGISKLWRNGLNESATAEPVWLRYASQEYRRLYENASAIEKENLEYTAKMMIFENQHDVDTFWEHSGLRSRKERQLLNESFVNKSPKISIEAQAYNTLPYTKEDLECYLNL